MTTLKVSYGTAATFTVTNLHSLASSTTLVAGWTSASVDNTTDLAADYLVGGTFATHASNRQAGSIVVYSYAAFNTTPTWPDLFSAGTEGTEGTATIHDSEQRDSGLLLVRAITVDNTASAVYTFPPTSIAQLYGGVVPPFWALFVTSNASTTTTAGLASSGSAIYRIPVFYTNA